MRRILTSIRVIENTLSKLFLFCIILLVFVASIFRALGYPLVWSVDMAQLLFVWLCFFGADIALQHDRHIGVDCLTRFFPKKVNTLILAGSYLLILGFLGIIIVFGTYLAVKNSHRLFNGMPLSYSWATMSAPIGCLLLAITIVEKLIQTISTLMLSDKPVPVEEERAQNSMSTEPCH